MSRMPRTNAFVIISPKSKPASESFFRQYARCASRSGFITASTASAMAVPHVSLARGVMKWMLPSTALQAVLGGVAFLQVAPPPTAGVTLAESAMRGAAGQPDLPLSGQRDPPFSFHLVEEVVRRLAGNAQYARSFGLRQLIPEHQLHELLLTWRQARHELPYGAVLVAFVDGVESGLSAVIAHIIGAKVINRWPDRLLRKRRPHRADDGQARKGTEACAARRLEAGDALEQSDGRCLLGVLAIRGADVPVPFFSAPNCGSTHGSAQLRPIRMQQLGLGDHGLIARSLGDDRQLPKRVGRTTALRVQ